MRKSILLIWSLVLFLHCTVAESAQMISFASEHWPVKSIFNVITKDKKHYIFYRGKEGSFFTTTTDYSLKELETKPLGKNLISVGYMEKQGITYQLWYDWDEDANVTSLNLDLIKDGSVVTHLINKDAGGKVAGKAVHSDSSIAIFWASRVEDDPYIAVFNTLRNTLTVKAVKPEGVVGSDLLIPLLREVIAQEDRFIVFTPSPEDGLSLIFVFSELGEIISHYKLSDFTPEGSSVIRLAGVKSKRHGLLLWGNYQEKDWWFAFFDMQQKKISKSAIVKAPLDMTNTIFAAEEYNDGSIYFCMRSFLFKLNSDFSVAGYWRPPDMRFYNLYDLQVRDDGKFIVSGTAHSEHGDPTVWIVGPEEFIPADRADNLVIGDFFAEEEETIGTAAP